MARKIDLTGMRFGKLTVLREGIPHRSPSRVQVTWECLCDCGNVVDVQRGNLRGGITISCGCAYKDLGLKKRTARHENLAEYAAWYHMKQRCTNQNDQDFKGYGGRGIKVCSDWFESFDKFFADMGKKPSPSHSIDRIDVNGNYEPSNCRWADAHTQTRNKRSNRIIEFDGRRMVLADWARHLGVSFSTLHERLEKHPIHIAMTTKTREKNGT